MKSACLFFVILLSVVAAVAQEHPTVSAQANTVYVGADGKFEAAPDTAQIQFNVAVQDETSQAAFQRASKNVEQVRECFAIMELIPRPLPLVFFRSNPPMTGNRSRKSLDTA
jgi:uncharacterized protein YggE